MRNLFKPALGRRASRSAIGGPRRERWYLPADFRTIYAIGDVHGHLERLEQLEAAILRDAGARDGESLIILLGDYVDRGPSSKAVIEHLLDPAFALPRVCLCGNHEEMMLDFLHRPDPSHLWLANGGIETLISYGLDIDYAFSRNATDPKAIERILGETIPPTHRAFIEGLPSAIYNEQLVFAHAGIRPGVAIEEQDDTDLLWIREPFLERGPELGDVVVVHGHTITKRVRIVKRRIGIDTGAYLDGKLTAARLADDGFCSISV